MQNRSTDVMSKHGLYTGILVVVLLARLGFAALVYARPELAFANDTDRYVPITNAILSGQAYSWNTDHPGELLSTIGYPLFLAAVFSVAGHDAGDVALAQLLVTGGAAFVLYLVLRRWVGTAPAFVSALLLAVDPLTVLWSMTVLTEALFAVTLGIGAALLASWAHSRSRLTLVLAGLFSGLACLVKPFALLVLAVWTLGLVLFPHDGNGRRAGGFPSAIRRAFLFLLAPILLIAPWYVRNGLLWGCPTLSSVDRVTMRDYMAAKVLAESEHVGLDEAQKRLQGADPGICPRETGAYWKIILANPGIYARLHAAGTLPVLFATNFDRWLQYFGTGYTLPDLWRPYMDGGLSQVMLVVSAEMRRSPGALGLMLALTAFQVFLYFLALVAAAGSFRLAWGAARWNTVILAAAILILILSPGQGGHERFRVPVQPLLVVLIGYGSFWKRMPGIRRVSDPPTTTPA